MAQSTELLEPQEEELLVEIEGGFRYLRCCNRASTFGLLHQRSLLRCGEKSARRRSRNVKVEMDFFTDDHSSVVEKKVLSEAFGALEE